MLLANLLRLGLGALLLGLPLPASAQITVYHSPLNDGVDPGGTVFVAPASPFALHLYIASAGPATATGTVCEDGDGSELCGYDLVLEALGGLTFSGFTEVADTTYSLAPNRIRLNVVEAINGVAGPAGPVHIGDITIDASAGTTIDVSAGAALDASLGLVPIGKKSLISVPEPGFLLSLGSGLIGLLLMWRRSPR